MRSPLAVVVLLLVGGCEAIQPAEPRPDAAADDDEAGADAGAEAADAGSPDAGDALVSTLVVKTDGSAVATPILDAGRTYTIVASGEFVWGLCDATVCPGGGACGYQRLGDAFHRSDDCWATTTAEFEYISLYVDGEQVDWGAYRSDHIYSRAVVGADASLQFNVTDCAECFGDNTGELQVSVYESP